MDLKFYNSKHKKIELTLSQKKMIVSMYKQTYSEIVRKLDRLNLDKVGQKSNYILLNFIKRDIETEYVRLGGNIENLIKNNMQEVSNEVIKENKEFNTMIGFEFTGSIYQLPTQIVNKIVTGKVYESGWTLSKAIWGNNKKTLNDINFVVAKGVTLNKSSYEIAKDLERYVNPSARKDWEWSKVYPNTNKKIDYNAQRLARTLVSHAYEQSIVESTKYNPFVKGIRWLTSNSHRVCPICMERDGNIYKPEELPLDHPNGMCTFEAVIEDDDIIINRIANWAKGNNDKELDKYAEYLKNLK